MPPAQPGYGRQFDKTHAVTLVAQAAVPAYRFVSYDGTLTVVAPGTAVKDCQGISEEAAANGEALSVVTAYSYLVEASAAIAFGDYVKPAADASGKAAVGSATDHCGRALGAASAAGQLVEVQILKHVHA